VPWRRPGRGGRPSATDTQKCAMGQILNSRREQCRFMCNVIEQLFKVNQPNTGMSLSVKVGSSLPLYLKLMVTVQYSKDIPPLRVFRVKKKNFSNYK